MLVNGERDTGKDLARAEALVDILDGKDCGHGGVILPNRPAAWKRLARMSSRLFSREGRVAPAAMWLGGVSLPLRQLTKNTAFPQLG